MVNRSQILATALLVLVCCNDASLAGRVTRRDNQRIPSHDRFNFFDLELLQAIAATTNGNVVVSPVSVKATLAMILEGAGGRSADQIRTALRLPENPSAIQTVLNTYLTSLLTKDTGYKVALSNRVFMSRALLPNQEYASSLQKYYYAEVEKVDFSTPDVTARKINKWVREVTQGLIQQLIEPGNVQPDAQVILANAIYFKGIWEKQFDTQGTTPRCFYATADKICRNVNMMETLGEYGYAYVTRLDAYALELPYKGDKFSMVIVMPNEVDGMPQLIRDILHVPLQDIVNMLQTSDVLVSIPRFNVEYSADLVPTLYGLQIQDIFGPHSNLTGLFAGSEASAQVSNVFHKAKIVVNEEGSEAAAGTGAQVIPLMGSSIPKFRADRPFLFFIQDKTTGVVLFSGRINEPEFTKQQNYVPVKEVAENANFVTSPRPTTRRQNSNRRTSTIQTTTQGREPSYPSQSAQSRPQNPTYSQAASQNPTTSHNGNSQNINSQHAQNSNTQQTQNTHNNQQHTANPQGSVNQQSSNGQTTFQQKPSNSQNSYQPPNTPRPNTDTIQFLYPTDSPEPAISSYSGMQNGQNNGNRHTNQAVVPNPLSLSETPQYSSNSQVGPRISISNRNAISGHQTNVQSQFTQNSDILHLRKPTDNEYVNQNTNVRRDQPTYEARNTQNTHVYTTQVTPISNGYFVEPSQLQYYGKHIPDNNNQYLTNSRDYFQANGGPSRQFPSGPTNDQQRETLLYDGHNYQQSQNQNRDAIVFAQRRQQ